MDDGPHNCNDINSGEKYHLNDLENDRKTDSLSKYIQTNKASHSA